MLGHRGDMFEHSAVFCELENTPLAHTHAIVSYCPITGLGEMNPFKYLARYGSVSSDPTALLDC